MKASFDASDTVTVISGGANGIGRALADALQRIGGTVHVLDVAPPPESASAATFHEVDVADRDAVLRSSEAIFEKEGRIDALVCAAVIQPRQPVLETTPGDWMHVQNVNLNGTVWCCQAFVPYMVKQGRGSVILFTSGLAEAGYPNAAAYSSTKGAIQAFARSLAKEIATSRVRVNLISPGVIDTPQFRTANAGVDLQHWEETLGVGQPEDVLGPLLFLLSDAATMTGSLLTREQVYRGTP